jgi:hypothetical protein
MQDDDRFEPRGAVAFFIAMMLLYAGIWALMMSIMIGRH